MRTTLICATALLSFAVTEAHAGSTTDASPHSTDASPHSKMDHHKNSKVVRVKKKAPALAADATQYQAVAQPQIPADLAPPLRPIAVALSQLPFPIQGPITYRGITIYGGLDSGIGYQTHGAPLSSFYGPGRNYTPNAANSHSQVGLMPNALSYSNFGIKGVEEVIPGLSFVFNLQTSFLPTSAALSNGNKAVVQNNGVPVGQRTSGGDSSRNGEIDNSQAYAGFSSPTFGTLTFGRQYALTLDGVIAYDPMSASNAFSLIGFAGMTAGGGNTEDARMNNALKYRVNFGPFRAAAMYQFEQFGNSNRNSFQAQLGGEYQGFSFDAIYSQINSSVATGSESAAQALISPNTLIATVSDNYAFMLLASYQINQFKFYGGYENIRFTNPVNPLPLGAPINGGFNSYPLVGGTLNANFTKNRVVDVIWGGVKYSILKDVDLIAAYYHYTQNSYATGANSGCTSRFTSAMCAGTQDAGSAVVDYRINKNFDVYAGAMYGIVHGGFANGYAPVAATNPSGTATNTIDPTIGARYQF